MKLAVVLPSRGLVFSQTVEELYRELNNLDGSFSMFWSHGRPIPACFNVPTEQALAGDFDFVLFVEEDMVLPEGILNRMLSQVDQVIACDYPVSGGSGGTALYDPEGRALFTGCGLLLVKTDLLRRMPKPIWRDDVRWTPYVDDGFIHFTVRVKPEKHYGQQDVAFGLRLYANGIPIEVMKETIGQREVVKQGELGANEGQHTIRDRLEIVPRTDLNRIPDRQEFQEIMVDGKRVKVKLDHLAKLDKYELPSYHKVFKAIFDIDKSISNWFWLQ